jgi:hypothetical protein
MVGEAQRARNLVRESLESGVYSLRPGYAGHDEDPGTRGEILAALDQSLTDDRSGCEGATAKSERRKCDGEFRSGAGVRTGEERGVGPAA